tara:strand:+ start:14241 stop:15341 length:1101 start_codon:yes stop_codon:yes gene_type:complete
MIINIIDPTCNDHTGHCYGYDEAITKAASANTWQFTLWLGRKAKQLSFTNKKVNVKAHFCYKIRKLQLYWVYRKLVRDQAAIFVPTATSIDILLLSYLLARHTYTRKIVLHFHQFNKKPRKIAWLKKVAKVHSEKLVVITTTDRLAKQWAELGFQQVENIPCPVATVAKIVETPTSKPITFLYAGAARAGKGFLQVVNWLQQLAQQTSWQPMVHIQSSATHSGKYDDISQGALKTLRQLDYPNLTQEEHSLTPQEYELQFQRAICLLLYDKHSYHDKFSGICLDALLLGAPVITVQGTWMGDMIERFDAGLALSELTADNIWQATQKVYVDYDYYRQQAIIASGVLRDEHDAKHTVVALARYFDLR